ncbi:hypothetical protein Pmani_032863, partial [Petrolisthes manimaculis]
VHQSVVSSVGGRADLPCNMTSPISSDDPALLILWYKSGIYKPIYTLDLRSDPPTHWKNPSVLGSRASITFHPSSTSTFHPSSSSYHSSSSSSSTHYYPSSSSSTSFHSSNHPPSSSSTSSSSTSTLVLQRVKADDEGAYRCKVSFRTSPTLTAITNLTVIVPPRRLSVYTDLGLEARSIVGPFTEGDTLGLTCRATGGSPLPDVTWWEGTALLDITSEVATLDLVTNTLVVPTLTRRDLHRTLTCQAANSNLTAPLLTTVTLDMNFPPLWVRLRSSREPVSAGQEYVVVCQAAGARPPATLTWRLGPTLLPTHHTKTSEGGNITTSEVLLRPEVEDSGKVLSCLAHSPAVPTRPLRDDWLLNVYYVPESILRPGSSLNLTNIEEGDDVYFECSVKANPWVYKIIWLHEDDELQHNVTGGIIISNQSLVLQRVSRTASGNYYCVASNIEGDGKSNPVQLSVKYAPVCRDPQVTYHGAARLEQVNIPCQLDAHPPPYLYRWTFNNSGESVDIPKDHIQAGDSGSTVSYTPNTELDYGTLLCWGTNTVGHQTRPCVFHVFPAGRPDPVYNCSSYNLSIGAVYVRCVAGFDGGLPQTFVMELYDNHSDTILLGNDTGKIPRFRVSNLPSGRTLRVKVFSTNAKGRSDIVFLNVYTLKDMAEKRTAAVKPSPPQGQSSGGVGGVGGVVGGVVGVVLGVLVGLLLVLILIPPPPPPTLTTPLPPLLLPLLPTDSPIRNSDEKNPDVIPHAECEGVTTISSVTLPTNYVVTLPHTRHLYTQPKVKVDGGGSEVTSGVATPPYTPSPPRIIGRRYTQRRDTQGSDNEATTPLIPSQKESSV